MQLTYRPILAWPGVLRGNAFRKRSQFKAGFSDTLALLDRELGLLKARDIVLQVALTEEEIRLDGVPRSGAKVAHPGVILTFESRHGALSYPCDVFTDWRDNLRAIALGLEHLRAVDRYGITARGEQYRGWTALPAPPVKMTKDMALGYLGRFSSAPVTMENAVAAYRQGALKLHPDRGGDATLFGQLQEAKEVLGI